MLRKIKKSDLKEILEWRNSPEVRKVMFTDHQITENEHIDWWKKIQADTQKEGLIFCFDNVNLGVVNYFDILSSRGPLQFYLSSTYLRSAARTVAGLIVSAVKI